MFSKRLEKGRFVWPSAKEGKSALTAAQLAMLREGIDWRLPQRSWKPLKAAQIIPRGTSGTSKRQSGEIRFTVLDTPFGLSDPWTRSLTPACGNWWRAEPVDCQKNAAWCILLLQRGNPPMVLPSGKAGRGEMA